MKISWICVYSKRTVGGIHCILKHVGKRKNEGMKEQVDERMNESTSLHALSSQKLVRNNTPQVVVHKYAVPYVLAQGIWILFWYFFFVFPFFFHSFKFKTFPYTYIDIYIYVASSSIICYLKWLLVMTKYLWSFYSFRHSIRALLGEIHT